jgi:hypothetical protein
MKRALPWLAAVFFIGCLALGTFVHEQKAEISRADAARRTAEKEATSRIAILEAQVGTLEAAKAQVEKQIAQLTQATPASDSPQVEHPDAGTKIVHISDIIKDHPEYAALYERQMRRNIDREYGNGLNALNLTPDQVSQLKSLLTEKQMGNIDAQRAAETAGLVQGSAEWQAAMTQASQDVEGQIQAIMGSNADALLDQMRARTGIQYQVQNSYSPDFSDAGIPLTPEQASGLINAMADANYSGKDTSTRPANYNIPDPTSGLSPHDDRIISNAAQVLTPAQIQLLTTDQMQNWQMQAIMKQYNTNSGGARVLFVP